MEKNKCIKKEVLLTDIFHNINDHNNVQTIVFFPTEQKQEHSNLHCHLSQMLIELI